MEPFQGWATETPPHSEVDVQAERRMFVCSKLETSGAAAWCVAAADVVSDDDYHSRHGVYCMSSVFVAVVFPGVVLLR